MEKGNIKIMKNNSMHTITGVLYVPALKSNLISLGQLQEKGCAIIIQKDCCQILHPQKGLIAQVKMTGNQMFPYTLRLDMLIRYVTNQQYQILHGCGIIDMGI